MLIFGMMCKAPRAGLDRHHTNFNYSGALAREARASEAPWVSKSTYPRKFGNHVTVH